MSNIIRQYKSNIIRQICQYKYQTAIDFLYAFDMLIHRKFMYAVSRDAIRSWNWQAERKGRKGAQMSETIYVRMKKPGRERRGTKPVPIVLEQRPDTLREMLVALVTQGVEEYNARRDDGKLLGYLTAEQIEEKAGTGKVSFGFRNGSDAEADPAVENALQCFQDGIYRVFAGQRELTELEERIPWEEEPVFTLIRLVMLAGL